MTIMKLKTYMMIQMVLIGMKKIKKILNKNEFWMGVFTLTTIWWLFNVTWWGSIFMIVPLFIAVTRP